MKKIIAGLVLSFAFLFGAANAATLTVTKIADTNDNVCDADCSLREAIFAASASGDVIEFASPLFDSSQTIPLAFGELKITKTLVINGRGANLTAISGENLSRIFRINGGNLTLNGLTVIGGRESRSGDNLGGGIFNDGILTINNSAILANSVSGNQNLSISAGGGIWNNSNSSMTMTNSTVSGNLVNGFAQRNRGGGICNGDFNTTISITGSTISGNTIMSERIHEGAGIWTFSGAMTISNSTISGNRASTVVPSSDPFMSIGSGGGIMNLGGAVMTILNSTISGNSASSEVDARGGGIVNEGTLLILNGTITGNSVNSSPNRSTGGGIHNEGNLRILNGTITGNSMFGSGFDSAGIFSKDSGTIRAANTIVSGNAGNDIFGSLLTSINNYIAGNAQLAPLGSNGGATQTHALLPNSPAINSGTSCVLTENGCGFTHPAVATDQRGVPRSFGIDVDRGAVEEGITISPPTIPQGLKNVAYSQMITATGGGTSPYNFTLDSGTLPTGITLSTSGLISGTTTQEGTFNFAVRATDANGLFAVRNYVLNVGNFVQNANNSGAGSLRQLIADAPAGGTIFFDPAFFAVPRTIIGNYGSDKNLTINGPGANLLTLDADNFGRVFTTGNGATVNVSGIRFTRGRAFSPDSAGGILIYQNSTLNATGIIVDNSTAFGGGGGIYVDGTLNLTDSTVESNTSNFAAGIFVASSRTATLTRSIVRNNAATGNSGGIGNNGTLNFYDSTVHGNTAPLGGGLSNGGFANFANATISGNRATTNKGGGIYNNVNATVHLLNTTVTNNRADGFAAAGIWNEDSTSTTVRARNTIIAGNISGNGNPVDYTGGITDLGNNLINTANPALAPLGNYGGATPTHALLANSPALNAGSDCILTANACGITHSAYPNDQRGTNAPRKIGASVDIGAFERNIVFDQTTLPNAVQNSAYNQTLTAMRAANFAENLLTSEKNDLFGTDSLLAPFTFSIISIAGQSLPNGLTISSAGIISGTPTTVGSFTFTVRATDTDGIAGVQQYTIAVANTPPTITASGISRMQSSPVSNSTIATVSDIQSGASGVTVTVTSANPSNGVTISNIVNTNGTITANVVAACGATNANFTLTATDGGGATATATLTVTVTANTAPTLVYPASFNVSSGGSLNISPTTATDNSTVSYSIFSVSPVLTTAPTIDSSGVVSITNASPLGNHTITIRATDACNLTTNASFTLIVEPPTRTVTKTDDTNDGICDADCSLREAIAVANSGDIVQFAAPLFNSAQTITLGSELSVSGKTISITGKGANLTAVSGNNQSRVFNVGSGGNLMLDGLTVTNGRTTSEGGGIYNGATLTILNSTVSNSSVSGGNDNFGGGIYNGTQATLTIRNSTISGNSVSGSNNFANRGGGIANVNGTLVITNSTVSGNLLGGGTNNRGGGIYSEYGPLTIINDTITNNVIGSGSFSYGGGLAIVPDGANLINTIISGNSSSQNPDIIGGVNYTNNFIGGDARLAPLGFYGGTTQTHALLPDSSAINAGNNCVITANSCANGNPSLTTDQRGSGRLIGEVTDIGAFESNITFDQTTLPNGNTSVDYSQQLSATRQTNYTELQNLAPSTFEIVIIGGQSLPPGITLSAGGLLSGMPSNFGIYNFTVKATDTDGIAGVRQYSMYVFSPTAANVVLSGSIKTANGSGIKNASVTLTDMNGNVRKLQTGSFGNYKFDNVEAGQTYVISVSAKRFAFAQSSRVLSVSEDALSVDFIAQE